LGGVLHLSEQISAALKPTGGLEIELAQQIVSVFWRLRRIPAFEAALMAHLREQEASSTRLLEDEADSPDDEDDPQLAVGSTVRDFLRYDYSDKLDRYQANLQRQFKALLKALHELKERRHEEEEVQCRRLQRAPEISGAPH
jgi:hypothetical protein